MSGISTLMQAEAGDSGPFLWLVQVRRRPVQPQERTCLTWVVYKIIVLYFHRPIGEILCCKRDKIKRQREQFLFRSISVIIF